MFQGVIAKRVQAVIKQRTADAQKEYDNHCNLLDEEHEATVAKLETEREEKKSQKADELVASILGK